MKHLLIFLLLCCSSLRAADYQNLYEESQFWPPRVCLIEPLELKDTGRVLPAGRHGILIRLENEPNGEISLLVDYGSNGLRRLRPEQTDVMDRFLQYKSGAESKSCPNWTMMIGRGFVRTNGGTFEAVKLNELSRYEKMLIVYDDQLSSESLGPLFESVRNSQALLEDSSTLVLVMPTAEGVGTASKDLLHATERDDLKIYYMYPYLANAFVKSLSHVTDETKFPCAILVDVEGKTISAPQEQIDSLDSLLELIQN